MKWRKKGGGDIGAKSGADESQVVLSLAFGLSHDINFVALSFTVGSLHSKLNWLSKSN